MLRHSAELAERVIGEQRLDNQSLVDRSCKQRWLFAEKLHCPRGISVLGIEPAKNVAEVAVTQHGIPTLVEFFTDKLAKKLAHEKFLGDVFHAHNVLAHVPDFERVCRGYSNCPETDCIAVIEAP